MHTKLMTQRTIAWFGLILAVAGAASAARLGRLVGKIVDPEGKPIRGVIVTASSPDVADFNEVRTTDKKGMFLLDFREINVRYLYRFECAGYEPLEVVQTWSLEGTEHVTWTMQPATASLAAEVPPASASNEAILAFNRGVAAFKAKEFLEAEAMFKEALGHDPELSQAWAALSLVQIETKEYEDAAEAAEKAIALGSSDEGMLRARWEAYRNLGNEAKAAEALEDLESAGQRAEEAKRVYNEGVALAKAGDDEGAFAKFQEAAQVDPNLREAHLAQATTAMKIGRDAEAVAIAEKMLERDPRDDQALRIRYNASLELGDEGKLVDALVGLAAVDPATAREGLWLLALAAYDGQDLAKARDRFGKLLQIDPNNARSHYLLGLVCVNEGANQEARSHLERFLELAPDDPDAETARELLGFLEKS